MCKFMMEGQLSYLTNYSGNKNKGLTYNDFIKERIDLYGSESLLNEELISVLTGIKLEAIKQAIENFGMLDFFKYSNALDLSAAQKRKLDLIQLFYRRMLFSAEREKSVINSSSKAGEYCTKLFTGMSYEAFYVICLDSQNRVNYACKAHEGTINESPVYPRVILEIVLNYKANTVILAHNHPGGSLRPSQADRDVTEKIQRALEPISVKIVDHIIVASSSTYFSFAEQGLLDGGIKL